MAPVLDRLVPPPRTVDWSLFATTGVAVATGIAGFWIGHPSDAAVFWVHAVAGLSILPLLVAKFRRVAARLRDRRAWDRATPLSVCLAAVAVAAGATGVGWALGATAPLGVWTLLNLHILFGLLIGPLLLAHLRSRFRPLRGRDVRSRRVALQYAGLVAAGGATVWLLRRVATLLETPAATRRFTGSRELDDGDALPVTSWVADDPDPIDPGAWTLTVDGEVDRPLALGAEDLRPGAARRAVLDCTSGWYAEREWQGLDLGALVDAAEPTADAAWVTIHSVTGYRWSLPLSEARGALLATRLSGERLEHGHGYPLRLVAPDRRGFQWVKWVERVELRRRPDPRQWLAVFVSGV
ncbi:molybdopterin-dependent oxidoreductase [Haloplanus ruber]|uniref:Molybdopterin-dependent oxidoreductase n=1 Tax=Haloplanus ruber TaxID=869892 RepID=A0ABD6D397_9EURY|nr:molybdopterin-dependent oxidoreductase [Haloplanus ruber]